MQRLMTKSEIMKLVASGAIHETFDHSTEGKFDVTAMRKAAQESKLPTLRVRIADVYAAICQDRVIDQARIDELDARSWKADPAMVVVFNEAGQTSHLLIDGIHRILRRHKEGEFLFRAWFIDEANVIRPDMTQWVEGVERGIDWGDKIEDGKIVKR